MKKHTQRTRWMSAWISLCLIALCGCQLRGEPARCDAAFVPVRDQVGRAIRELRFDGGAFLLKWNGQTVCEAYFGSYTEYTTVPLASATKWLSAATILTLVDDGTLALEDPVSKYLPYFSGDKRAITLRQLLSHTSGLPSEHPCMFQAELTLDECARRIATLDLLAPPGTQFNYGGAAFTVAGRMAEAASDLPWRALFEARLQAPLHLNSTSYGLTDNPVLSEGSTRSSLRDYGAFLHMILDGGRAGNRRILSEAAIAEMQRDQTAGTVESGSARTTYGLGVWRDRVRPDGTASQISSPGAGGFVPWVDWERNVAGVLMVFGPGEQMWETALQVQQETRAIVDAAPRATRPAP